MVLGKETVTWLLEKQNKDGCWSTSEIKYKEPYHYFKSVILTSECVRSLIFTRDPRAAAAIRKALRFCLNHDLEENDLPDMWALKLQTISLSNLPTTKLAIKECLNFLSAKQKSGSWGNNSPIPLLSNYYVLSSLWNFPGSEKQIENAKKWFDDARAKDGKGWGIEAGAVKSEFTFTANALLALILTGEDPTSPKFKPMRKFLEEGQEKDGTWASSKMTVKKSTTYATALGSMALALLSENPLNKRVQMAVDWLKSAQNAGGGWPLIKGENSEIYTTYFALYALSFFDYVKSTWDSLHIKQLRERLEPQQVTSHLLREFEISLRARLGEILVSDLLSSKALGTTSRAVERRKDIMKVLAEDTELEPAQVIDKLKELPGYTMLNKKSHMTQIKSDLEYLRDLHLVDNAENKYYVVLDIFSYKNN